MKLREESAPQAVITAAEKHIGRLSAHDEAEHLAPPVQELLNKHKAADAEHHKKVLARMLLTGKLEYADDVLDNRVLDASHKALDVVGRDRSDARYRAAFPISAAEGTDGMATDAQDIFIDNVVRALRAEPDFAHLSAVADDVEAAHAEVKALRAQRDAAYSAEMSALTTLRIAQVKLIDAIRSNRSRLELLFPKQRKRVSSFF